MANKYRGLIGNGGLAAGLLLAASPLLAQDNASAAPDATPPAADIGPRELSNFTLNGTVTREAQPQTQPAAPPPAATPVRQPETRSAAPATARSDGPALPRPASGAPREAPPESQTTLDPISGGAKPAAPQAQQPRAPVTVPVVLPSQGPGFSPLPWIAGLLMLAAAAAIYFGLKRRRRGFATAGGEDYFEAAPAPRPAPTPLPADPSPQPLVRRPSEEPPALPPGVVTSNLRAAHEAEAPPGVVTASLRPWIELELEPSQAMLTDDHAAIAFDVTIFNSGSAPARDVAVEACMINAGEQQDAQLGEFYMAPSQVRDKIPAVAPMARVKLKSAVRLPRASVREYEVEGRKLFMPMVALNSRYRWSSGEGHSAASFLVGGRAANDSAKLSPLRLDQGKRGWKTLAARRYEKGIRS